jgi:hypothetical protein
MWLFSFGGDWDLNNKQVTNAIPIRLDGYDVTRW